MLRLGIPLLVAAAGALCAPARAADGDSGLPDWLAVHGQGTFTLQGDPDFPSPYAGPNSLKPGQRKETIDATLFAGVQPWKGGEFWVNPEIDQGFGLSNTLGVAGFPSAEAYKVGKKHPYVRLQRAFFRQTIDLGGPEETVEGDQNVFAGKRTANRLVLTVGKFGVGDVFDTNKYAHDPRNDFLNWSVVDAGSFDYAADAWGYSTGISAEWYRGAWALRFGAFNLSKIPNGEVLERDFDQYQLDLELEHRHQIAGHPGAVRVTLFRNRGQFGRFDDALALASATGGVPDTALVRRRMTRPGISLNAEQEVTGNLGLFARAGLNDGQIEPYDFTDIDRTLSLGASLKGEDWGRVNDTVGLAGVFNGIGKAHERYLDAGGIGVLVGDGQLPHPGTEMIAEAYYDWQPVKGVGMAFDYQFIANPAYNRDRGPANVLAVRVHGQF
jgi:high affinity Mn2+ porin